MGVLKRLESIICRKCGEKGHKGSTCTNPKNKELVKLLRGPRKGHRGRGKKKNR